MDALDGLVSGLEDVGGIVVRDGLVFGLFVLIIGLVDRVIGLVNFRYIVHVCLLIQK